jgi:hypothetical protein
MRLGNGSMPQAPWTFSGANFALSSIATMLLHRCDDAFLLDSETRGVFSYQGTSNNSTPGGETANQIQGTHEI